MQLHLLNLIINDHLNMNANEILDMNIKNINIYTNLNIIIYIHITAIININTNMKMIKNMYIHMHIIDNHMNTDIIIHNHNDILS